MSAMTIDLDHLLVPTRDRVASARLLAQILGVGWAASGAGPFSPVYVNEGLTIDFDEADGPVPTLHCAFRVAPAEFDAILARLLAAGLPYRSTPHGPVDQRINTDHGGRIAYWSEPGGHVWEILTERYAGPRAEGPA